MRFTASGPVQRVVSAATVAQGGVLDPAAAAVDDDRNMQPAGPGHLEHPHPLQSHQQLGPARTVQDETRASSTLTASDTLNSGRGPRPERGPSTHTPLIREPPANGG